jgi:hypothetical protein
MLLILLIVVLLLVFGGGGGYYGYRRWGSGGGIGIVGVILIALSALVPVRRVASVPLSFDPKARVGVWLHGRP